ncbi:MAG: S8 family serine peptidase [Chloroflexota bacterium]
MRRVSVVLATVLTFVLVAAVATPLALAGHGGANNANSDTAVSQAGQDTSSAIVQLKGDPLSTSAKTKPAPGKKIDFNSNAVRSYRAQLSAQRNDFKAWLRANAPKAKVTGEYDIALNAVAVQLNGESLAKLQSAPMVQTAQYEGLYYPTSDDPDLGIIKATEAWAQGGRAANAGTGVKVAVVDTGIDAGHPCFSDNGYPSQTQLGDKRFTNNKVIVAKVFNNKTPSRRYTPEAIQEHGTHVAGTIGCNYQTPATVNGVTIPYDISGVAPRALLGNYNVFPGDVLSARSEDIMNALEAAYQDGFDVANMSLGGGARGIQDLLTIAVNDLDQANMVVAVAAGNSGPDHYTIESPGSAARALTAGASTVPHFVGTTLTVASSTFEIAAGDFATVSADLTANLGVVKNADGTMGLACSAIPANVVTGEVAVISRGTCAFSVKIRNAQAAGAVAAIIVNNVAGDPISMGTDGTPNQPTIPAYMVGVASKGSLLAADGLPGTIIATNSYFSTTNANIMAGFSSQGPTDVDFRVKPDVVAPGVNVLSSIPLSFCGGQPCFAFFQGTSMATPHLAGSAAVVKWEHPTWSAAQIRSAIVNTADQNVLTKYQDGTSPQNDVNVIGAGLENLLSAVNTTVALDPVSVSFGALPSGAGQTQTFDVTLTNVSSGGKTFSVAVGAGAAGVAYSVSPASLTLAAGESGKVTVAAATAKGATAGDHQAWLTVSVSSAEVAHAAVYTFIK